MHTHEFVLKFSGAPFFGAIKEAGAIKEIGVI